MKKKLLRFIATSIFAGSALTANAGYRLEGHQFAPVETGGQGLCFYSSISHGLNRHGFTHVKNIGSRINAPLLKNIADSYILANQDRHQGFREELAPGAAERRDIEAMARALNIDIVVISKDAANPYQTPPPEVFRVNENLFRNRIVYVGHNGSGHFVALDGQTDEIDRRFLGRQDPLAPLEPRVNQANAARVNNDASGAASPRRGNDAEPAIPVQGSSLIDHDHLSQANSEDRARAEDRRARAEEQRQREQQLQQQQQPSAATSDRSIDTSEGDIDSEQEDNQLISVPSSITNNSTLLSTVHGAQNHVLSSRGAVFSEVASGQADAKNEAWISGFSGNYSDKSISGLQMKHKYIGGAIGYDYYISESTAIGAAITVTKGTAKFNLNNEKAKNTNYILSLYSFTGIDDFVLSGMVFVGRGKVKVARTFGDVTYNNGKFTNLIYGAKAEAAYRFQYDQHIFTPSVGLSYIGTSQKRYEESVPGQPPINYSGKRGTNIIASAAAKYEYVVTADQVKIIPSIQLGLSRDLVLSNTKLKYREVAANGQDVSFPIKPDGKRKTTLFVTPGVTIKKDNFDFSVAYTLEKAKKYNGNFVAIKLVGKF